jgi:hypothetical protein
MILKRTFVAALISGAMAIAAIPVQHATTEKKNRYMELGVFVGGHSQQRLTLLNFRHSLSEGSQERLVLDMGDGAEGRPVDRAGFFHVSIQKSPRRVVIDLENTEKSNVTAQQVTRALRKSPYFAKAEFFFDHRSKNLTIELPLKSRAQIEVFELVSIGKPGRIVIDAKRP